MKNKLLPQKLKELRKVNNYTQDYVAEVLGVVRQTYSHYETGKRTPDAPTQASTDLSEFLEFFNDPSNKKKYMFNTNLERELLFYFDKISDEDKKEIIEFTKIKARKPL